MRLDKYLKVCRIIKRRTISKDIINFGQVKINDKIAKPSSIVHINDKITLYLGNKKIIIRVLNTDILKQSKAEVTSLYEIISEEGINAS